MIVEHDVDNSKVHMNNPAIVVDTDTGVVLKMGDSFTSDIKEWYNIAVSAYSEVGSEITANSLKLISFDRYNDVIDIDGICTMINYMRNSIGCEKMNALLNAEAEALKLEIAKLQTIGF